MTILQQRDVGGFRIYAGTFEAHGGGFTAAVEVHRMHTEPDLLPEVVFSNDSLSKGHRFNASDAALKHAMDVGHQVIRLREVVSL